MADIPDILSVNQLAFKFGAAAAYNAELTAYFTDIFLPCYYKDSFIQTNAFNTSYIIKHGQQVVCIGCYIDNEVFFLHTHPDYFKQGYGSHMLDFLEKEILNTHKHVELSALLNAVDFYKNKNYHIEKFSYIDLGKYQLPAIKMLKNL